MNITPKVNCQYGAPMGRNSWNDNGSEPYTGYMYLRHICLDNGGYDNGGAYWGIGRRLYGYTAANDSVNGFVRADDRHDAKEQVLRLYPQAKFYR